MKILHLVAAPTMTGPADPALGLARGQAAAGAEVSFGFDTLRSGNMAAKVAAEAVTPRPELAMSTKGGLSSILRDRGRLRALADRFDVIHVHSSHDHTVAALARGRATIVRSIHHPRGCRRRGLLPWVYGRTDGFVVLTREHREQLLSGFPRVRADHVGIVGGAVDPERFHPDVDGAELRRHHGFSRQQCVFGVVARIKPGRGHALFIEALQEVRRSRPGAVAVLIGKGEGVDEVSALVRAAGLESVVAFSGFRDHDLPEAIRSCDFTVLMEEGNDASCRAVLESMACGVPVVGASHPAIQDALDEAGVGRLFQAGDRGALVEALLDVASWSPQTRASAGDKARARILAGYTDRVRAERVLAHYARLGVR